MIPNRRQSRRSCTRLLSDVRRASAGNATRAIAVAAERVGVSASAHVLRHAAISRLISAGLDVVTVQRQAGHSRPSVTLDVYSQRVRAGEADGGHSSEDHRHRDRARTGRMKSVDLDETIRAFKTLEGEVVEATVWGPEGEGGGILATIKGTLSFGQPFDPDALGPQILEATREALRGAEQAMTYAVDDHSQLSLWPDRFVQARSIDTPPGVEIITRDGVLWIRRYRPWID